MDSNTLASIAGLLLAALGIVLAVRWRPKTRVLITSTRRTRLSLTPSVADLQVSWKGSVISEPVIVEVTSANHGTSDIQPSAFEGGSATVEVAGTRFLGVVSGSATRGVMIDAAPDGFRVLIPPMLLKSGEGVRASIICDGMPRPATVDVRLADVQTSKKLEQLHRSRAIRNALLLSTIAYGVMFFGTIITNVVENTPQPNLWELLLLLSLAGLFTTFAGYKIIGKPVSSPEERIDYGKAEPQTL